MQKMLGQCAVVLKSIHKSDQMLPSLKTFNLLVPLLDVDTLDVICYDFAPRILSVSQNKELMLADNLVLDPTNPLAKFVP